MGYSGCIMEISRRCLLAVLVMGVASAQDAPLPSGHWEGSLKVPNQDIPVTIDLYQDAKQVWTGHMAINAPGAPKEIPISKVTINADAVGFSISMGPQPMDFRGKMDAAQKALNATAALPNGQEIAFALKMTGPAQKLAPSVNTPISKELEGSWSGELVPPGAPAGVKLRLTLDLSNGLDGKGIGVMTSVDQGNTKFTVGQLTQQGKDLSFEIRQIGGSFKGTANEANTEIKGSWSQGQGTMELTLRKGAAAGTSAAPSATPPSAPSAPSAPAAPKPAEKK